MEVKRRHSSHSLYSISHESLRIFSRQSSEATIFVSPSTVESKFDWGKYQFIPPWGMMFMMVSIAVYTMITSDKLHIIQKDFQEPRFLVVLLFVFAFLFLVKDENPKRTQYANDAAIIAGISAYFGHLDMPMMALFIVGIYSYYSYSSGIYYNRDS